MLCTYCQRGCLHYNGTWVSPYLVINTKKKNLAHYLLIHNATLPRMITATTLKVGLVGPADAAQLTCYLSVNTGVWLRLAAAGSCAALFPRLGSSPLALALHVVLRSARWTFLGGCNLPPLSLRSAAAYPRSGAACIIVAWWSDDLEVSVRVRVSAEVLLSAACRLSLRRW